MKVFVQQRRTILYVQQLSVRQLLRLLQLQRRHELLKIINRLRKRLDRFIDIFFSLRQVVLDRLEHSRLYLHNRG